MDELKKSSAPSRGINRIVLRNGRVERQRDSRATSTLNTYHRDGLTNYEQMIYDELCRGIRLRLGEIRVHYSKSLHKVIVAVNYDHPEFFYVNWMEEISYTIVSSFAYVRLNYVYSEQEATDINIKMVSIAKSIKGDSEYLRALNVHDWLVKNIKYDHSGLKEAILSPEMFNVVGAVNSKKAVCEGISKLTSYIMRAKGIGATMISGFSRDGTPHAWNLLEVDSKRLYADVTYDIGLSANGTLQRRYFLISRSELLKDHVLS